MSGQVSPLKRLLEDIWDDSTFDHRILVDAVRCLIKQRDALIEKPIWSDHTAFVPVETYKFLVNVEIEAILERGKK